MRVLAFGGIGSLTATVALLIYGAIATGDPLGGVMLLFCFGGFVIPAGFLIGCWVGAIVIIVARRYAPQYTPLREGPPLFRMRFRLPYDHADTAVWRDSIEDSRFPSEFDESVTTERGPSKPTLPPSA